MARVILVGIFILAIPLLFAWGFFHALSNSFDSFGLSPVVLAGILFGMLMGSFLNIPLGRQRLVEGEVSRFFGLVKRRTFIWHGLSINVGGAIIPVALAIYLLPRVPLQETLLATGLVTVLCYSLSRVVPEKGITISTMFPALFATIFALVLALDSAAPVAFIAGVFGVLIGADLFRLSQAMRHGQGVLSIGGAGVFDGIFLVAIIAAFLASL